MRQLVLEHLATEVPDADPVVVVAGGPGEELVDALQVPQTHLDGVRAYVPSDLFQPAVEEAQEAVGGAQHKHLPTTHVDESQNRHSLRPRHVEVLPAECLVRQLALVVEVGRDLAVHLMRM